MMGNQNRLNTTQSEETKQKISNSLIGVHKTEQAKLNMRKPKSNKENFGKKRKGTKFSDEWKDNLKKASVNRMKPVVQYDLKGVEMARFEGVREASRQTGIYDSAITMCCKGKLKSTHKCIFKYVIS
jgi:hypothetical protein